MSLVAAAVLPHPPVLHPAVARGAAPELDDVRTACAGALSAVARSGAGVTYVIGVDSGPHARSLAPWGVAEPVDVPEPLPLSLLVGAWLTAGGIRSFVAVDDDLDPTGCAELGRELAASGDRVAFVVMADGSARLSEKAPGYLDPRAADHDAAVASALDTADAAALLRLDPGLARELMVAGRAPLQVLAGAALALPAPAAHPGAHAAPYGVGYHVVTWAWQEIA